MKIPWGGDTVKYSVQYLESNISSVTTPTVKIYSIVLKRWGSDSSTNPQTPCSGLFNCFTRGGWWLTWRGPTAVSRESSIPRHLRNRRFTYVNAHFDYVRRRKLHEHGLWRDDSDGDLSTGEGRPWRETDEEVVDWSGTTVDEVVTCVLAEFMLVIQD